jgi:tripartite-type tricarboxylate transporter receptor subunit TctC
LLIVDQSVDRFHHHERRTMLNRRHFMGFAAAAAGASSFPDLAAAQPAAPKFPNRNVRLVVPVSAGGANDVIARLVGNRLSEIWGHQVVVENKPGAGGNLGGETVARAEPDGYTFLLVPIAHAVNKFLFPSLSFDPVTDFAPISLLCTQPNLMVVPNSSPAKSVAEFIAYAKANRGKVTYASAGAGTSLHLCAEMFKRMAGIEMIHVPYRGTSPAFADLIPGRVDVMFNSMGSALPLVREGTVRALAVSTLQRVPQVPDMPTVSESGVPGFDVSSWFAFFAPAKTPPDIVDLISRDTVAALAHPPVKAKLEELGSVVIGSTPVQLAAHLKSEMDKWGPLIKATGMRAGD